MKKTINRNSVKNVLDVQVWGVVLALANGLTVAVETEGWRLSVAIQVPGYMRDGRFEGLLGHFDGFASNDLITDTGSNRGLSTATNAVYNSFGESCKCLLGIPIEMPVCFCLFLGYRSFSSDNLMSWFFVCRPSVRPSVCPASGIR